MKTPDNGSNKTWSRRDFVGTTPAASKAIAASRAASAVAPEPTGATVVPKGKLPPLPLNPRTAAAMPMRNLGKPGFRVGIFSLGCQAAIEIKGNAKLSVEIMNRALDLLAYNCSLPVSTNIVGVDNLAQLEEDLKCAVNFVPLSLEQMRALEERTLPIVRQGLYFRRWDLGA